MMTPEVLEREARFELGVEALSDENTAVSEVIDLARHPDGWAASMALVALERRDDVPDEWVDAAIRALPRPSNCEDAFQLRAIARHAGGRAIGRILGRTEGIYPAYVVDFVTRPRRGRGAHRRRHLPRQRDGRPGRRARVVSRPDRRRDGRRRARRVQGMADARALRLHRTRLATPVRPAAGAPRRPAKRRRGPRRRRTDGRAAPLGHPRRRARRGQDGARACGARPDPGHHGLRGDCVPGHRRPGLHRGARRPRQAARRRDARPQHDLGAARAPGGALRGSAHTQPSGAPRRPAAPRRVRLDDAARRGDAHRARRPPGIASARHVRVRRRSASERSTRTTRSRSPATRSSTTASMRRRTTRRSHGRTTSRSSSSRAPHRPAGSSDSSARPRSRRRSAARRSSTVATSSRRSRRHRGCRSRCSTPPRPSDSRTSGRSSRSASCSSPTR